MPWQTPTLQELVTARVRDLNAAMPGADASLARNNLSPVAKMLAGGFYEIHRATEWAIAQRFILTCDDDQLDRHGAEMKPSVPRKPGSSASGLVEVTALSALTILTGAVLARSDDERFVVSSGIVLTSGATATIAVVAQVPGASGATSGGAVLSASSGVTGTATFIVSSAGFGGAADEESDGAYRTRLLFAKAFPEHGGAPGDWLRYTLAVPGVTRAFIDPLGAGRATVVVYPLFDGTRPNGIGLESDRLLVQSALDVARPGAGLPVVTLPVPRQINVRLAGVLPSTPEVRAAIEFEIMAAFASNSRVSGMSDPHLSMPFLAVPQVFSRSWIWQAVANASGEERHEVLAPSADVVLAIGEVPVPGTIIFE